MLNDIKIYVDYPAHVFRIFLKIKILILGAKPEDRKEIHVLSLDGGGSRGIMESIMLGHIMNLATIMKENPEEIYPENIFNLLERIENHPNPIHPTDAFQYIVGES